MGGVVKKKEWEKEKEVPALVGPWKARESMHARLGTPPAVYEPQKSRVSPVNNSASGV